MITLGDIFNDLSDGELNQFSISGIIDGPLGIVPESYPVLIRAINLGLTDLHTKLNIREREVTINLFENTNYYELDSRYSIHATTEDAYQPKYIQDTVDNRFSDDVIQIVGVYDECGEPLPVNSMNANNSVFLANYKTIQICGVEGEAIIVTYQANHPKLAADSSLHTELFIPEYLREALYAYVVYRVLMRSQNMDAVNAANIYKMKYDTIVNDIKRLNTLATQDNTIINKVQLRGWV